MDESDKLLQRIEGFCERFGVTESRFGREALSDTSFIPDLRAGRAPTTRTVDRVERYMALRGFE